MRRWLVARREAMGSTLPWLRGEPATGMSPDWRSAAKIRIVAAMAWGFDAAMRRAGFTVRGPLTGFYDWQRAGDFAGLLGRSAARVIQDRLMIEARRDLVYTAMSISQISFRLGFSDPAYFSRFFAKRAGVSP